MTDGIRYFVPWAGYERTPEDAIDAAEKHGRVGRVVLREGPDGQISASVELDVTELVDGQIERYP